MIFVFFDDEIALLLPWALNIQSLGISAFIVAMLFIATLIFGLFYEWKKAIINW